MKNAKVWKGEDETFSIGLVDDLYVTIPRRHYNDLKAEINIDKKIIAPVSEGVVFGSVNVSLAGEIVANKPLIALKDVKQGGFINRLYDEAMLMLE